MKCTSLVLFFSLIVAPKLTQDTHHIDSLKNALSQSKEDNKQLVNILHLLVCFFLLNDKIEIKVRDNGNGIPQKVVDKIFQSFFTTKPTGQETGLGLSLSYDIIKAHGGK